MSTSDKLQHLEELRRAAQLGGGEERIAQQHARGKLIARERLEILLDEGSFAELDAFVTHRAEDFGLDEERYLGDGVVTGWGRSTDARPLSTRRTSPCSADPFRKRTPKRSAR